MEIEREISAFVSVCWLCLSLVPQSFCLSVGDVQANNEYDTHDGENEDGDEEERHFFLGEELRVLGVGEALAGEEPHVESVVLSRRQRSVTHCRCLAYLLRSHREGEIVFALRSDSCCFLENRGGDILRNAGLIYRFLPRSDARLIAREANLRFGRR